MREDVIRRAREFAAWSQWPQPEFLTALELAAIPKVPVSWVRAAGREGRIPMLRVGHYMRFSPEQVIEALTRSALKDSQS
jgi:hypothetical protein